MWQRRQPRQRRQETQPESSSARQRITATYAVVALAIVLLWLLPLPTASTLSAQLVALTAAFVGVRLVWWMYGWRRACSGKPRPGKCRGAATAAWS